MSEGAGRDELGIEVRWPDLFAGMSSDERRAVVQACANSWHSGWKPNREDVADAVDVVRGTQTIDEVIARATAEALRSD